MVGLKKIPKEAEQCNKYMASTAWRPIGKIMTDCAPKNHGPKKKIQIGNDDLFAYYGEFRFF